MKIKFHFSARHRYSFSEIICWRNFPLHAGWVLAFHEIIFDYTFILWDLWYSILFHDPYVFTLLPHCFQYCCSLIFFKASFLFLVSNIKSQLYLVSISSLYNLSNHPILLTSSSTTYYSSTLGLTLLSCNDLWLLGSQSQW